MCVCANALLGDAQVNLLSEGHLCNRGIPGTVLTLTTSLVGEKTFNFHPGLSILRLGECRLGRPKGIESKACYVRNINISGG